jgi:hypothetical protein
LDFSRPGNTCQVLFKGDTVFVPSGIDNIDNLKYTKKEEIIDRLYIVTKFTKQANQIYFLKSNFASSLDLEFESSSYKNSSPNSLDEPKFSIRENCIKVKINRLGEIVKI